MKKNNIVLSFGHKRQRGKDTCCDYLVNKYGFTKLSFAAPLKNGIGKGVFGLSDEQLHGKLKSEIDPYWEMTPRYILQQAGTEAMRNTFGEDIWCKTLGRTIYNSENRLFCISDMRFRSELNYIKKEFVNSTSVVIHRYDIPFDKDIDNHKSEIDLDGYYYFNYFIYNVKDFDYLYGQLDALMIAINFKGSVDG